MKIPEQKFLGSNESERVEEFWMQAARQAGLDYGVYVEVLKDWAGSTNVYDVRLMRIYFKVGDRQFEGLRELKRALRLKAFW